MYLQEFKAFIARGNVIDLAVGIVVGASFGKIVSSFVEDILMPPIGLLLGNIDFSDLFINLSRVHFSTLAQARAAGAPTLNYGLFINHVVSFLIVSFSVFLVVKFANKTRTLASETKENSKECSQCISLIPKKASRCKYCTSNVI